VSNNLDGLVPVGTLLLGFALNSFAENLKYKREIKREAEKNREQKDQLRHSLQLTTLQELPETVIGINFVTYQMFQHYAEVIAAGKRNNQLPKQLDDKFLEHLKRLVALTFQITDQDLKKVLRAFFDFVTEVRILSADFQTGRTLNQVNFNEQVSTIIERFSEQLLNVQTAIGVQTEIEMNY